MRSSNQATARLNKATPSPAPAALTHYPPRNDPRLFRHELTPMWLRTAAAFAGEDLETEDHLDRIAWLGCRAFVTPAVVAAVHPSTTVHAWDPNPARLAALGSACRAAKLGNIATHDQPRPPDNSDYPPCDLVVIDGIVDSVDSELRNQVLAAAASLLRPGGLLAIAYRTAVGWGEVAPLVRLLRHTLKHGSGPDPTADAIAPLEVLKARGAAYMAVRPTVAAWLDDLLRAPADQVIDSYLVDALRPLSHAQVSEVLADFGTEFVGQARLDDFLHKAPTAVAQRVRDAPTVLLRETLSDLAVRRTARIDLFRLGRAGVGESDRERTVQTTRVMSVRLPTCESVGAPWARHIVSNGESATISCDSDGFERVGGFRVCELWPAETRQHREVMVRQVLDAGLAHPVRDSVPDQAMESAARLTVLLERKGRPIREQFAVSAHLGTALPSEYVRSVDEGRRRALGLGER